MVANQTKEKEKSIQKPIDKKPKKTQKETSRPEGKITFRQLRKSRTRKFPIWLRIIVVLLLAAAALAVGAMVGYSIIGSGESMFDVFDKSTWTHIYDIIYKEK